jgi:transcription elongation factor B subunit 1
VIEYLQFKVQYAGWSSTDIREDFQNRIDPYIALEL